MFDGDDLEVIIYNRRTLPCAKASSPSPIIIIPTYDWRWYRFDCNHVNSDSSVYDNIDKVWRPVWTKANILYLFCIILFDFNNQIWYAEQVILVANATRSSFIGEQLTCDNILFDFTYRVT